MSDVKVLGRPAEYDKERSLNAALAVFWRKGYEATSLADLCEAMGMSKSTLYAVFVDKRQLFLNGVVENPVLISGGIDVTACHLSAEIVR